MKPTPEQVIAWAEQAYNAVTYADVEDKGTHRRAIENKIAELAAQWGYEQAQRNWKSDIPVPLLERLSKTLTNLGYATTDGGMEQFGADLEMQLYHLCRGVDKLLKGAIQAQQTTEPELPEAVAWWCCVPGQDVNLLIDEPSDERYPPKFKDPLFTAAQMHDHYQAGVRVGMGQSQDAKRWAFLTSDGCDARNAVDKEHRECIYYVWQLLGRENPISTKKAIDAAIDAAISGASNGKE